MVKEFFIFGIKQARACIFAGSFFLILFISNYIPLFGLARYDFIFLATVALQIVLVATKLETKDEVKSIALFHVVGFVLEAFKTHPAIASWSYPEPGFFKVLNVPLYSGFMYAAIGSYIAQAWSITRHTSIPFHYLWRFISTFLHIITYQIFVGRSLHLLPSYSEKRVYTLPW